MLFRTSYSPYDYEKARDESKETAGKVITLSGY